MAKLSGFVFTCIQCGKLAFLPISVSGAIVLQILACALYDNWWPMLTAVMYVLLPMPLVFFTGFDTSSLFQDTKDNRWFDATKFMTGASTIATIAIPVTLKHAGFIGWGALLMQLSSFVVLISSIMCFIKINSDDSDCD